MNGLANTMTRFRLDPILAESTRFVTDLNLCQVLFKNDSHFPWLILVPRHPHLKEIMDLSGHNRAQLIHEIAQVSKVLRNLYSPDKINVASLGNQVAQLHIHIIARYEKDIAWPEAPFGIPPEPYDGPTLESQVTELQWRFSEDYTQRLRPV